MNDLKRGVTRWLRKTDRWECSVCSGIRYRRPKHECEVCVERPQVEWRFQWADNK